MRGLRVAFILLVTGAIALPFVPIAGPLSTDDLLPLIAVGIGFIIVPFATDERTTDASLLAIGLLAFLAFVTSGVNATSLGDLVKLAGRSGGRLLFFAAFIISTRAVLDRGRWPQFAVVALAGAATAEAVFCVWAWVAKYHGPYGIGIAEIPGWSVLRGHVRVHGTFSGALKSHELTNVSANFLASYFVLSIPATLGVVLWMKKHRWRLAVLAGASLQIVALYLTYTRAALVALAVSVLAFGWFLGRRKLAFGAVVVAAMVTLAIPSMRAKFFKEGHNRYTLWAAAVATVERSPLVGVGDGNYIAEIIASPTLHQSDYGSASTTPHNSILMTAANLGLGGAVLHVLIIIAISLLALGAIQQSRDRENALACGLAASLIGYLVQDQFNNLSYVPKVATQMWFIVALLPLLIPRQREEELRSHPQVDAGPDRNPAFNRG